MSKPDIHLLALCYELEIERNGGDWRIRNDPTQKGLNGKPPAQGEPAPEKQALHEDGVESKLQELSLTTEAVPEAEQKTSETAAQGEVKEPVAETSEDTAEKATIEEKTSLEEDTKEEIASDKFQPEAAQEEEDPEQRASDDDDSDGWITPSNLKKHQAKDSQVSTPSEAIETTLQAALLTSDFAMQNVALRINLLYVCPS